MKFEARFALSREDFSLDFALEQEVTGITGLFGPSGSGKTTVLRLLAGLERPQSGFLRVGEEVWQDDQKGVFLPTHRRRVGYVFQEASLFEHLDVEGNLRFGWSRTPVDEQLIPIEEAVEAAGIGGLLDRHPATLSGGERQRVAIARTILAGPRLLLLDEPSSALDEPGRRDLHRHFLALVERLDIPVIYVTHSVAEIGRIADQVGIMEGGRLARLGPIGELCHELSSGDPRETLGAVLVGTVAGHDEDDALSRVETELGDLWVRRVGREIGDRVRVQILARDVAIDRSPERRSSVLNQLRCEVEEVTRSGESEVHVRLRGESGFLTARVTRRSARHLELSPGTEVTALVKAVGLLED